MVGPFFQALEKAFARDLTLLAGQCMLSEAVRVREGLRIGRGLSTDASPLNSSCFQKVEILAIPDLSRGVSILDT